MLKKNDMLLHLDESLDLETRVQYLLKNLTIREKFKLLAGKRIWWTRPVRRLKVPSMGMSDGPRGISFHSSLRRNTQFPVPKCLAATWDPDMSRAFGAALAEEVRARKKHVVLAPGINIDRIPLNGRTFEYFSEDPTFTADMAAPMVDAIQEQKIAACLKHYAANNQETNRRFINAVIDERTLRETYLKAFEKIIRKSQPWTVMTCYNRVNGDFGSENHQLLNDLLINTFGFKGMVISDWYATENLKGPEKALKAGLCLEMPAPCIFSVKNLTHAFMENRLTVNDIDRAVGRILRVMVLAGVFNKSNHPGSVNTGEHQAIARRIAEEGMVLLKNDNNVLPLNIREIKTIALLGANADKRFGKALYGGSSAVIPPFEVTALKGLKSKLNKKVTFVKDPALADAAIIVTGLNHDKGSDAEASDRVSLELSPEKEKLILKTASVNPATIVILMNGSPIAMKKWIDVVPAVLEAWYPGMHGGDVIADILFGDVNPSGKLPITFPDTLDQSPALQDNKSYPGTGPSFKEHIILDAIFKKKPDQKKWKDAQVVYKEGIFVGYRHFDYANTKPLFPFGFGLSYTTFTLSNARIENDVIKAGDTFRVKLQISNTGSRRGAEVVQVYYSALGSHITRAPRELAGFKKICLDPGETREIIIVIDSHDLAFYDIHTQTWSIEKTTYQLHVGTSSRNISYILPLTLS